MQGIRRTTFIGIVALMYAANAHARTVYRCMRDGTVSRRPREPGSRCEAKRVDDNAAVVPNLASMASKAVRYARTRWTAPRYTARACGFDAADGLHSDAAAVRPHAGLGLLGAPQPNVDSAIFHAAARERHRGRTAARDRARRKRHAGRCGVAERRRASCN